MFYLIGQDINDFKTILNHGFDKNNHLFSSIKEKLENLKKESISEETYMELTKEENDYIKASLKLIKKDEKIINDLKNKYFLFEVESIIDNFSLDLK